MFLRIDLHVYMKATCLTLNGQLTGSFDPHKTFGSYLPTCVQLTCVDKLCRKGRIQTNITMRFNYTHLICGGLL